MIDPEDRNFENYLKSFRPRDARPLSSHEPRIARTTLAALTFACVLLAIILYYGGPNRKATTSSATAAAKPITLMQLDSALRSGQFEAALTESEHQTLPRTDQPNSALRRNEL
jgi:hypothetical protein